MELNVNIEEIVANAVTAALAPEKLLPIVQNNVEKAVKSAIESQFNRDAPFNKLLKEKVSESMPTDIEDMGRFGDLVLKTVSAHFNGAQQDFVRQAIEPKLASMLRQLPARMKLSELAVMLTKEFYERFFEAGGGSDSPTLVVERSTGIVSGYWYFGADPKSGRSLHSCSIVAAFNDEGKCYSLKCGGEEFQKKFLIGPTFNADALMLNIYTGGVTIELDKTDFSEVYYSSEEDY